ncbi:MAG TPA: CHAT domain-containing protein, partial [Thermoanaerobaculia bacterium]|nr:CHAT domain-containing protein [Thermoanaerobaculia bacterium]
MLSALVLAATLLSAPVEDRVVAALASGSLASFEGLVADPRELDEPEWSSLRDFLGRYECIDISAYRAHDGVLDIEATATTRNARHERRALSQTWRIARDGGKLVVRNEAPEETPGDCDVIAKELLGLAAATNDAAWREELLQSAIGLAESVEDPRDILAAMARQAEAVYLDYDLTRSFDYAKQLETLSRRVHSEEGEARGVHGQVRLAHTLGRSDEAIRLASHAAAIARHAGYHEIEAISLYAVGQTRFIYKLEYDVGLELLHHALEITPKNSGEVLSTIHATIGFALARVGRLEEAEPHLEPAIRLPQNVLRRTQAYWFAVHLRRAQGRYQEAVDYAHEGIRLGTESLWMVWTLKEALGAMLADCGDPDGGIEALRETIDLIETRRAIAPAMSGDVRHFSNKLWIYHELEDALVDRGRLEEAFDIVERTRGRVLYDAIRGGRQELALTGAERARERALNQRIIDANRELATAAGAAEEAVRRKLNASRAELTDFVAEMAIHHAHSSASATPALDLAVLPIDAGTAAVIYSISAARVNAYVVNRGGRVSIERLTTTPAALSAAVRRLRDEIETRNYSYRDDARELHRLLIEPIARHLAGARRLIIVPDTVLWNAPFQVLLDASGSPLAE